MKSLIVSLVTVFVLASGSAWALDIAALNAALANSPSRPQADKDRDADRKPAETLDFFGLEPGMTAVDLVAAAGYFTEVLSVAVGPNGKVYMQNAPASLTGERGERTASAINDRLANNRLANVERLDRDYSSLGLPDNSVDIAVIALEFHELYRSSNTNAASEFLAEMRRVLKPNGVLGVIDHSGNPGNDNGQLHRAVEADVLRDAEAAGFVVAAHGEMLHNSADDRTKGVFDPSIRGVTDQFVLKLVSP